MESSRGIGKGRYITTAPSIKLAKRLTDQREEQPKHVFSLSLSSHLSFPPLSSTLSQLPPPNHTLPIPPIPILATIAARPPPVAPLLLFPRTPAVLMRRQRSRRLSREIKLAHFRPARVVDHWAVAAGWGFRRRRLRVGVLEHGVDNVVVFFVFVGVVGDEGLVLLGVVGVVLLGF